MTAKSIFSRRIALLKKSIERRRLDSLLITKGLNVSYMSGFTGHDATILITPGRAYFITDSRYIEDAGDSVKGFEVRLAQKSLYLIIKEIAVKCRLRRMGFESANLPFEVAVRLKKILPKGVLVPAKGPVEELRAVKDAGEISLIRGSIRLTKQVFDGILPFVKAGASEQSLARKMETDFIRRGARPSFDLIVAADANSSKPHAVPTARRITRNSSVMMDIGCLLDGYASDITRMVINGKIRPKIDKIYKIVRDAQAKAIGLIRPGARISEIDAAARQYIRNNGFGGYFGHALGHGIGMEVHEDPSISGINEGTLRPGMVFTVEPAIYIPKVGGVRLEDMVLVTQKGCEILSR